MPPSVLVFTSSPMTGYKRLSTFGEITGSSGLLSHSWNLHLFVFLASFQVVMSLFESTELFPISWEELLRFRMYLPQVRSQFADSVVNPICKIVVAIYVFFFTCLLWLILSSYLQNKWVQFLYKIVLQDSISCCKKRTQQQKGFKLYLITLCSGGYWIWLKNQSTPFEIMLQTDKCKMPDGGVKTENSFESMKSTLSILVPLNVIYFFLLLNWIFLSYET